MSRRGLHLLIVLAALGLTACGADDDAPGPDAAVVEAPDYEAAFPQDRVPRLDIVIAAADWQAMLDDMSEMLGAFGEGGGPGGGGPGGGGPGGDPPEPFFEACVELVMGDACSVTFFGMTLEGMCTPFTDGRLVCEPNEIPGGGGPGGDGGSLIPRTPLYVECDIATEDRTWSHVGVRFKGNSSLALSWLQGVRKLPLRLNLDKFQDTYPETAKQRFYGFESLGLSNGWQDPSLVRDKLGTDIFGEIGLRVPATAFYRVFVDHGDGPIYFGLYTMIEIPSNTAFLDTNFGNHDGNLYKPDGAGARWNVWDPETLDKKNNEAAADFSDAMGLFDALHADRADAAVWRAGLEARLDVDGFLLWLGLNTVIQDWDTYGLMSHNYYLYSDPADGGRFQWIPWDHSFAFSSSFRSPLSLGMSEVGDDWPLIRYLLDDPTYMAVYRDYLLKASQTVYEPAAAAERFRAAHELIAPYVVGAEGEGEDYTFTSATAFAQALNELIDHAGARQQAVADFLAR